MKITKKYSSIPHIASSDAKGDKRIIKQNEDQLFSKTKSKKDLVIFQEKYDGTNVSIIKQNNELIPCVRAGYTACSSEYWFHHEFHNWVTENENLFDFLKEGERLCGEWLLQPHGIYYVIPEYNQNFIAFDIFDKNNERLCYNDFISRIDGKLTTPRILHIGNAKPIEEIKDILFSSHNHPVQKYILGEEAEEGFIARYESNGKTTLIAKWVRKDYPCGKLMNERGMQYYVQ